MFFRYRFFPGSSSAHASEVLPLRGDFRSMAHCGHIYHPIICLSTAGTWKTQK